MQTNRKSFGTLKSDRYIQVTIMDEWPLLAGFTVNDLRITIRAIACFN